MSFNNEDEHKLISVEKIGEPVRREVENYLNNLEIKMQPAKFLMLILYLTL